MSLRCGGDSPSLDDAHLRENEMTVSRATVMIAHREPLVRAGLETALQAHEDFEVVSLGGALDCEREPQLDTVRIVVTDFDTGLRLVTLPGAHCYRVLIVTQNESEASIRRAIEAGACGYLLLTATLESIVGAVRDVMNGGTAVDPIVITKMLASRNGQGLTPRELDVLRLMIQGLTNKTISKRLARSVGTVKTHVKAIFVKLNATTRTQAVTIAQRRGLVTEDAPARSRAPINSDSAYPRFPTAHA